MGKIIRFIRRGQASFHKFAAPLRRRLLLLLFVMVFTVLSGVFLLLALSGVFSGKSGQTAELLERDFSRTMQNLQHSMGTVSTQAVRLSQRLSQNISGVFFTLDATSNPSAPGSQHSRAGLYIRFAEPSSTGVNDSKLYLYGPIEIGRGYGLKILSKWSLEFDMEGQAFFHEPMDMAANHPEAGLAQLVFWDYEDDLAGLSESVVICAVPLVDENGKPFGVCGFEISDLKFKWIATPDTGIHYDIFCALAPAVEGNGLNLREAMFSGGTTVCRELSRQKTLNPAGQFNALSLYEADSGTLYAGRSREIGLYGADSLFAANRYRVMVAVPKSAMDGMAQAQTARLALILLAMIAIGVCLSVVLSRRFARPILDSMSAIDKGEAPTKTNITEIDFLIGLMQSRGGAIPANLFDDFIVRVQSLTHAELDVFKAHTEGKTTEEMAKSLYIAVSTLKKHNGHIYEKLGVSSQEELRLYVSLMKQCGMLSKIIPENEENGTTSGTRL